MKIINKILLISKTSGMEPSLNVHQDVNKKNKELKRKVSTKVPIVISTCNSISENYSESNNVQLVKFIFSIMYILDKFVF